MDWNHFDRGVFLLNVLGIVYNPKTKKILIGRRENDPFIKNLKWCFPGGRPAYQENLEYYLKHEIKIKTGLEIEVKQILLARTFPDDRKFLLLYYLCEPKTTQEKAGEKFVEVKWINTNEVKKYFKTSIDKKLLEYLKKLN